VSEGQQLKLAPFAHVLDQLEEKKEERKALKGRLESFNHFYFQTSWAAITNGISGMATSSTEEVSKFIL
jgi:hypothetical protein